MKEAVPTMPAPTAPSSPSPEERQGAAWARRRAPLVKTARGAWAAFEVLVSSGTFAVALLTTYEVAGRKLFAGDAFLGSSLDWVEEISTYIIGWVIMVFIGIGVFRDNHIAASVIPSRVLRVRGVGVALSILRSAAFIVAGLALLHYGWQFVVQDWNGKARSISSLSAPFWIVHLCLPIGGALITVGAVWNLAKTIFSVVQRERSADESPMP